MKTRTIGVVCRWITLALAPLLLVGCIADAASGVTSAVLDKIFEEGPTEIEAEMIAKADVNPDYDGQPSPLVVRMYQLSSPTAFKNAGFFALYDGDVATLGNESSPRRPASWASWRATGTSTTPSGARSPSCLRAKRRTW